MYNRQKLRQHMTIHCLFFITLSKNMILSQMKYHWIGKGYSFKTHIHILPSMLHRINRSCRNIPISCKFCKLFIFFLKSSLWGDMNIHFSYYEIAEHHLTKMHTWFNFYYSISLAGLGWAFKIFSHGG